MNLATRVPEGNRAAQVTSQVSNLLYSTLQPICISTMHVLYAVRSRHWISTAVHSSVPQAIPYTRVSPDENRITNTQDICCHITTQTTEPNFPLDRPQNSVSPKSSYIPGMRIQRAWEEKSQLQSIRFRDVEQSSQELSESAEHSKRRLHSLVAYHHIIRKLLQCDKLLESTSQGRVKSESDTMTYG